MSLHSHEVLDGRLQEPSVKNNRKRHHRPTPRNSVKRPKLLNGKTKEELAREATARTLNMWKTVKNQHHTKKKKGFFNKVIDRIEDVGSKAIHYGSVGASVGLNIAKAVGKSVVKDVKELPNTWKHITDTEGRIFHDVLHPGDAISDIKNIGEDIYEEGKNIIHDPKRVLLDGAEVIKDTIGHIPIVNEFVAMPAEGALTEYYSAHDLTDYLLTTVKYGAGIALSEIGGSAVLGFIGGTIAANEATKLQQMKAEHDHMGDENHAILEAQNIDDQNTMAGAEVTRAQALNTHHTPHCPEKPIEDVQQAKQAAIRKEMLNFPGEITATHVMHNTPPNTHKQTHTIDMDPTMRDKTPFEQQQIYNKLLK